MEPNQIPTYYDNLETLKQGVFNSYVFTNGYSMNDAVTIQQPVEPSLEQITSNIFSSNQSISPASRNLTSYTPKEAEPFLLSKNYSRFIPSIDNTELAIAQRMTEGGTASSIFNKSVGMAVQGFTTNIAWMFGDASDEVAKYLSDYANGVQLRNQVFFTEQEKSRLASSPLDITNAAMWDAALPSVGFSLGNAAYFATVDALIAAASTLAMGPGGLYGWATLRLGSLIAKGINRSKYLGTALTKIDDIVNTVRKTKTTESAVLRAGRNLEFGQQAAKNIIGLSRATARHFVAAGAESHIESQEVYRNLRDEAFLNTMRKNGIISQEMYDNIDEESEKTKDLLFNANLSLLTVTNLMETFFASKYLSPFSSPILKKVGINFGAGSTLKKVGKEMTAGLAKKSKWTKELGFAGGIALSGISNAYEEAAQGYYSELARRRGYNFYLVDEEDRGELLDEFSGSFFGRVKLAKPFQHSGKIFGELDKNDEMRIGAYHGAAIGMILPLFFRGAGAAINKIKKGKTEGDIQEEKSNQLIEMVQKYGFAGIMSPTAPVTAEYMVQLKHHIKTMEVANLADDPFFRENAQQDALFEMVKLAEETGNFTPLIKTFEEWGKGINNISDDEFSAIFKVEATEENKKTVSDYYSKFVIPYIKTARNSIKSLASFENRYRFHSGDTLTEEQKHENKKHVLFNEARLELARITSMTQMMSKKQIDIINEFDPIFSNDKETQDIITKLVTFNGTKSVLNILQEKMENARNVMRVTEQSMDQTGTTSLEYVKAKKKYNILQRLVQQTMEYEDLSSQIDKAHKDLLDNESTFYRLDTNPDYANVIAQQKQIKAIVKGVLELKEIDGNLASISNEGGVIFTRPEEIAEYLLPKIFDMYRLQKFSKMLIDDKGLLITQKGLDKYLDTLIAVSESFNEVDTDRIGRFIEEELKKEVQAFKERLKKSKFIPEDKDFVIDNKRYISVAQEDGTYKFYRFEGTIDNFKLRDYTYFTSLDSNGTVIFNRRKLNSEDIEQITKEEYEKAFEKIEITQDEFIEASNKNIDSVMDYFAGQQNISGLIIEEIASPEEWLDKNGNPLERPNLNIPIAVLAGQDNYGKMSFFMNGEKVSEELSTLLKQHNKLLRLYNLLQKTGKSNAKDSGLAVQSDTVLEFIDKRVAEKFAKGSSIEEVELEYKNKEDEVIKYTRYKVTFGSATEAKKIIDNIHLSPEFLSLYREVKEERQSSIQTIQQVYKKPKLTIVQVEDIYALIDENGNLQKLGGQETFNNRLEFIKALISYRNIGAIRKPEEFEEGKEQLNTKMVQNSLKKPIIRNGKEVYLLADKLSRVKTERTTYINKMLRSYGITEEKNKEAFTSLSNKIKAFLDKYFELTERINGLADKMVSVAKEHREAEVQSVKDELNNQFKNLKKELSALKAKPLIDEATGKELTQPGVFIGHKLTLNALLQELPRLSLFTQRMHMLRQAEGMMALTEHITGMDRTNLRKALTDGIALVERSSREQLMDVLKQAKESGLWDNYTLEKGNKIETEDQTFMDFVDNLIMNPEDIKDLNDTLTGRAITLIAGMLRQNLVEAAEKGKYSTKQLEILEKLNSLDDSAALEAFYELFQEQMGTVGIYSEEERSDVITPSQLETDVRQGGQDLRNQRYGVRQQEIDGKTTTEIIKPSIETFLGIIDAMEKFETEFGKNILGIRDTVLLANQRTKAQLLTQHNINKDGERISPFDDTETDLENYSHQQPNHIYQTTGRDLLNDPEYEVVNGKIITKVPPEYNPDMKEFYEFLDKYGHILANPTNGYKMIYLTYNKAKALGGAIFEAIQAKVDYATKDMTAENAKTFKENYLVSLIATKDNNPVIYKGKFMLASQYTELKFDRQDGEDRWFKASTVNSALEFLAKFDNEYQERFKAGEIKAEVFTAAAAVAMKNKGIPYKYYPAKDKEFLESVKDTLIEEIRQKYSEERKFMIQQINELNELITADIGGITSGIYYKVKNNETRPLITDVLGYGKGQFGDFLKEYDMAIVKTDINGKPIIYYNYWQTKKGDTKQTKSGETSLYVEGFKPGTLVVFPKQTDKSQFAGSIIPVVSSYIAKGNETVNNKVTPAILHMIGAYNQQYEHELGKSTITNNENKNQTFYYNGQQKKIKIFPDFVAGGHRISLLANVLNWGMQKKHISGRPNKEMFVDFKNKQFWFTTAKGFKYQISLATRSTEGGPANNLEKAALDLYNHLQVNSNSITTFMNEIKFSPKYGTENDAIYAFLSMLQSTQLNVLDVNLNTNFILPTVSLKGDKLVLETEDYSGSMLSFFTATNSLRSRAVPLESSGVERIAHQRSLIPETTNNGNIKAKIVPGLNNEIEFETFKQKERPKPAEKSTTSKTIDEKKTATTGESLASALETAAEENKQRTINAGKLVLNYLPAAHAFVIKYNDKSLKVEGLNKKNEKVSELIKITLGEDDSPLDKEIRREAVEIAIQELIDQNIIKESEKEGILEEFEKAENKVSTVKSTTDKKIEIDVSALEGIEDFEYLKNFKVENIEGTNDYIITHEGVSKTIKNITNLNPLSLELVIKNNFRAAYEKYNSEPAGLPPAEPTGTDTTDTTDTVSDEYINSLMLQLQSRTDIEKIGEATREEILSLWNNGFKEDTKEFVDDIREALGIKKQPPKEFSLSLLGLRNLGIITKCN